MKVIIPFSYYYPEQCAGLNIISDVVEACANDNIEVLIYVPYPSRNVAQDSMWNKDEYLHEGKVHIHRFPMFKEGKNPILRAFRYFLCELIYTCKLLFSHYDVIYLDSTPPIQGLKIPLIKLFRKKPVFHNAQDLFPESLVGAGLAQKGGMLWHIGNLITAITYKYSDKIITISEDCRRTILNKGVPPEKVSVVYNWVDEEQVHPIAKSDNPLYKEFALDKEKFRIVYAGNLGYAQNIDIVISVAEKLKANNTIEFVLFGSGGIEADIRTKIINKGLNNVKLFPLQPANKVSYVYSLGDLCLVSCKAGFGGNAMPSKSWSILSTGRPILANFDEGELKRIIEDNDMGFFTNAGDVAAVEHVILEAYGNPMRCKAMGNNGRKFIESHLTKDKNTKKYVSILKELASKS
jgi:glycosyltransferase involved in cell wall biosynthesis